MIAPILDTIASLPLTHNPHWVVWRLETKPGQSKPSKIPYNAKTGNRASSTDGATWHAYEAARAAYERGGYDGIGFVVSEFDPFVGVDLDGCVDDQGNIADWAQRIVDDLDTYTELSPSGTGLRLWCVGKLPDGSRNRSGSIEVYQTGRFLTVSGAKLPRSPIEIRDRESELAALVATLGSPKPASNGVVKPVAPFDPNERLQMALNSATGEKIRWLFEGDTSGYSSASEADLTLVNHLLWWASGNVYQTDQWFRQSSLCLYRPKWDEKHGIDTYGNITLNKALADFEGGYDPVAPSVGINLRDQLQSIADIADIADSFDQWVTVQALADELGKSPAYIKDGLKALVKSSGVKHTGLCESVSLADFLALDDANVPYVVPGLLPRGELVLLVAPPKMGKSTLAIDLAYAVTRGDEFLDDEVTQGGVLLVTPDSGSRSAKSKLIRRGFEGTEPLNVIAAFSITQLAALERELVKHKPTLVIIDSLSAINRTTDISENDADIGNSIYALRELMERHNCGGVLIHHSRKGNGEKASIDAVRGSSAITAAVWGVWRLKRLENDRTAYTLDCDLRDAPSQSIPLLIDDEIGHFSRTDEHASPETKTLKTRVYNYLLSQSPTALELWEIADHIGGERESIKKTLN